MAGDHALGISNAQVDAAFARSLNAAESVLEYGADPSGATDSTSAFVSAVAANDGRNLYVPKGTYLMSETGSTGACLAITHSIALIMDPEATLVLDTDQSVPIIVIGDNATAFSNVRIVGGKLDGDAANSTITPAVRTSLLEVRGPVTDVLVADMPIGNALLGGVEVSGTDTNNRAERVHFERCPVDNVTEGVVIQFTNGFHWRGGDITNMTMQDCFEPHGGINGWSLSDCTISGADPTNSEVEIYPQVGDIENGVIENVCIKGEMRISLSSPDTYEVNGLAIRDCVFENGLIYAGVGTGRYRHVVADNCEFIGPASNVPRPVPTTYKSAIHAYGADNRMDVLNCRAYEYEGTGISTENDGARIIGNTVYNNGQAGAAYAGYLRSGLNVDGDNALVMGNRCFDDQGTVTQVYTPQINGNNARIIGNHFTDAQTVTRSLGSGWLSTGNMGDFQDVIDCYVTLPNDQSWVNLDQSALPGVSVGDYRYRVHITPMNDYSPATRYWAHIQGNWRIQMDAVPTNDVQFHITVFKMSDQVDATL